MVSKHISGLFRFFKKFKISPFLLSTLILLSTLMVILGNAFKIKNHLTHPQFTETISKEWFLDNVVGWDKIIYTLFFIIDFIWAPILLFVLHRIVKWKIANVLTGKKWISIVFALIAITSLTLDYIENVCYLTQFEYPKIAKAKNAAYGATFLVFITVCLLNFKWKWLTVFLDFIKSAWISLLILFILGSVLPSVPQFNAVIVDLYYRPFQLALLFLGVFAPLYAAVLSHYPSYLSFSTQNNNISEKKWMMASRFWLFGTIWYTEIPSEENETKNKVYESKIGFLRRVLGIVFYAAIFFLLAYTADTNFNLAFKFAKLTPLLLLILVLFLYHHKKQYSTWRKTNNPYLKTRLQHESADIYIKNSTAEELKPHASLLDIRKPLKMFIIWLCVSILLLVVLLVLLCVSDCPYSISNVILSLVCVVSQTITYVYYRTYRNAFKYVFFVPDRNPVYLAFNLLHGTMSEEERKNKKAKVDAFFEKHDFKQGNPLLTWFSRLQFFEFSLASLSNHVVFLKRIVYFGHINAIVLLVFNFFSDKAVNLNSAIIILSYFFLFYGMIIIILKHIIYYKKSKETFAEENKAKFGNTLAITFLVLFTLNFLARFNNDTKSELYVLDQIDRNDVTKNELTLKEYVENLEPDNKYYIGCYGGGMKANAWTMTVLDTLQKEFNILDKATCLSGASGGTIGLINYATIYNENNTESERTERVREIATENILSIDLTHILGRDLFNHLFVPLFDLKGKDRSTVAMKQYAKHANFYKKNDFGELSYRVYWKKIYNDKKRQFPILIANSSNILGRQGMAVSVSSKDGAKKILYAGADDILELDSIGKPKTLSYYNAASTTNRFPLISPAATIKGKGQYNDGGIFENSGLLSAYKLYEAINYIDCSKSRKSVFINIVNSKELFIKEYVKNHYAENLSKCFDVDINEVNEINAILNSVAATEMFPVYIKDKIDFLADSDYKDIDFINIYLPHQFGLDDIKSLFKPEIKDELCVDALGTLVSKNQKEIDSILKKCNGKYSPIIEPELSRVIAKPAHDFMLSMLKHRFVRDEIDKLEILLSED